jgi:hypothetical protein
MRLIRSRIFRLRGQKLIPNYYKEIEGRTASEDHI